MLSRSVFVLICAVCVDAKHDSVTAHTSTDKSSPPTASSVLSGWQLVWSDEFNAPDLNLSVWNVRTNQSHCCGPFGGSGELELYVRPNMCCLHHQCICVKIMLVVMHAVSIQLCSQLASSPSLSCLSNIVFRVPDEVSVQDGSLILHTLAHTTLSSCLPNFHSSCRSQTKCQCKMGRLFSARDIGSPGCLGLAAWCLTTRQGGSIRRARLEEWRS